MRTANILIMTDSDCARLQIDSEPKKMKRHELPLFYKLPIKFNIETLLLDFDKLSLNDYSKYNDLNHGSSFYQLALSYRTYLRRWFMTDNEYASGTNNDGQLVGNEYRQIALTEYEGPQTNFDLEETKKILTSRSKKDLLNRVNPNSSHYIPEADERNYTKRTALATHSFANVLDTFKAKVTRSRFAVLMPGFKTATHIDSDTDYTIRIHIPLITNPKATFGIIKKGKLQQVHLPADGSAWFVNAGYPHFVENLGTEPRVHIIIALDGQEDLGSNEDLKKNGLWI